MGTALELREANHRRGGFQQREECNKEISGWDDGQGEVRGLTGVLFLRHETGRKT